MQENIVEKRGTGRAESTAKACRGRGASQVKFEGQAR